MVIKNNLKLHVFTSSNYYAYKYVGYCTAGTSPSQCSKTLVTKSNADGVPIKNIILARETEAESADMKVFWARLVK